MLPLLHVRIQHGRCHIDTGAVNGNIENAIGPRGDFGSHGRYFRSIGHVQGKDIERRTSW
jgi:hypothetical protein